MKLSTDTLSLLNNFSTINANILFTEGNTIRTMTSTRNVFAQADITETIPTEFAIYDLKEFLSAVSLVDDADVAIDDSGNFVTIESDKQSITYYATDKENVTAPPAKGINMPTPEVTFTLTADQINSIRKAASVLGHANVSIVGSNGRIKLSVYDKKTSTSNKFELLIDPSNDCKEDFEFVLIIGDLKLFSGDYTVELSSKLITKFTNTVAPVTYWIAAEKSSTFGG